MKVEKATVGFDLDLVICILWYLRRGARETLEALSRQGYRIVIVTRRPRCLTGLTKRWLESHRVPCDQLYMVAIGGSKLPPLQSEHVIAFVDNNRGIVAELRQARVNAIHFVSWSKVLEQIDGSSQT